MGKPINDSPTDSLTDPADTSIDGAGSTIAGSTSTGSDSSLATTTTPIGGIG